MMTPLVIDINETRINGTPTQSGTSIHQQTATKNGIVNIKSNIQVIIVILLYLLDDFFDSSSDVLWFIIPTAKCNNNLGNL